MFHIHRGGSSEATKDKGERFVPIHPRIRPIVDALPRSSPLVLPGVRDRRLLAQLKSACAAAGLGRSYKVHSLRHHFASMVANHGVSYKKALAWMGHADSEMLSNYYHLHDEESERSMQALASDSGFTHQNRPTPGRIETLPRGSMAPKGSQRGTLGAKTKTPRP
jgi:integrase